MKKLIIILIQALFILLVLIGMGGGIAIGILPILLHESGWWFLLSGPAALFMITMLALTINLAFRWLFDENGEYRY